MWNDTILSRYADVLIWGLQTARQKPFRKGDVISVRFDLAAVKLAEIVYEKLVRLGYNPIWRLLATPKVERDGLKLGNEGQITFEAPGTRALYENLNGGIFISAPDSLTHLKDVDPGKIARSVLSRKHLKEILDRRDDRGLFGWTLCTFPTAELARSARLSLAAYARQIVRACYLDDPNPVARWQSLLRQARVIKDRLGALPVEWYHVESAHTDLWINAGKDRRWVGVSGHNIPSFEIFTSPDWRKTRGVYGADQPSYRQGNIVEGVRLEFRDGRVVRAGAKVGQAFLRKQLAMDEGARSIGEFSLTDARFSRIDRFMADTLYDENFGGRWGNCHIAVGSSYADAYAGATARLTPARKKQLGFNDSALHWDLVNTQDKTVTAHLRGGGRETIYAHGRFVL